jgi:hypothetical protein
MSRDVPADAGFLFNKASVHGETIKGTPCITHRILMPVNRVNLKYG